MDMSPGGMPIARQLGGSPVTISPSTSGNNGSNGSVSVKSKASKHTPKASDAFAVSHVASVQIEKLSREIDSLTSLLDNSERVKDMQRKEVMRLRKQLIMVSQQKGVPVGSNLSLNLPSIITQNKSPSAAKPDSDSGSGSNPTNAITNNDLTVLGSPAPTDIDKGPDSHSRPMNDSPSTVPLN